MGNKKNSNDEMTNSKKEYDRLRQVFIGVLDTKSAKNFINNLSYNNIAELAGYTYYYFGEITQKDSNAFIDTAKKKKTDALKFIKEMIDLMNRSIEIIRYYDFLEKVYKDVSKYWDNNKDATTENLLNECKKYLNVTKEINEEHKIEKEHWYFEFSKLLKEKVLQVDSFLYNNVTKDLDKAKDNLVAKLGDNIDEKNQKFVDSANELINDTTQFEKHEDFIKYSKKAEILKNVIVAVEERLEENNSNIKSSKKNNEQKTAEDESIFDNSNKDQSLDDKNFKGKSVVEDNYYDLNGPSTSSNNISVAREDDLSNNSNKNRNNNESKIQRTIETDNKEINNGVLINTTNNIDEQGEMSNDIMTKSKMEYDRFRPELIGVVDSESAKNFMENLENNNIPATFLVTARYFNEIKEKDSNACIETAKMKNIDPLQFIHALNSFMRSSIEIIKYYGFLENVYKELSEYGGNNKDDTVEKLLNECKEYLEVKKEIHEKRNIEKEYWHDKFSKLLKEIVLRVDSFLYKDLIKDLVDVKDNLVAKLGDNIDKKNQKLVDSANEHIDGTTKIEEHEDFIKYSREAKELISEIVTAEIFLEEDNRNTKSSKNKNNKKNNVQKTAEVESIFDNGPSTSNNNISGAQEDDLSNSSFNNDDLQNDSLFERQSDFDETRENEINQDNDSLDVTTENDINPENARTDEPAENPVNTRTDEPAENLENTITDEPAEIPVNPENNITDGTAENPVNTRTDEPAEILENTITDEPAEILENTITDVTTENDDERYLSDDGLVFHYKIPYNWAKMVRGTEANNSMNQSTVNAVKPPVIISFGFIGYRAGFPRTPENAVLLQLVSGCSPAIDSSNGRVGVYSNYDIKNSCGSLIPVIGATAVRDSRGNVSILHNTPNAQSVILPYDFNDTYCGVNKNHANMIPVGELQSQNRQQYINIQNRY